MSNIKINNTDIANYGFIPTKYLEIILCQKLKKFHLLNGMREDLIMI